MNTPTQAKRTAKVIPFARPTRKVSRSATDGPPRRAVGDELADNTAAPVSSRIALALGGLLYRVRQTGRPGAVAIVQFTDAGLFEETFGAEVGRALGHAVRDRLTVALRRGDQCLHRCKRLWHARKIRLQISFC